MKYILNRDAKGFDWLKGDVFDVETFPKSFEILKELGWLDEVKEEKTVWDLKEGDTFYSFSKDYIAKHENEWNDNYPHLIMWREIGDVFLTRESAERELEIRKARAKEAREGLGLK